MDLCVHSVAKDIALIIYVWKYTFVTINLNNSLAQQTKASNVPKSQLAQAKRLLSYFDSGFVKIQRLNDHGNLYCML